MSARGELVRLSGSIFWELRGAWATGKRVALSLDRRAAMDRIEGHVTRVSATDAFVHVGNRHIPGDLILAVHSPSLLGDSTGTAGAWHGPALQWVPQKEQLWDDPESVGEGR